MVIDCKDCLHYVINKNGDWYCRKHYRFIDFSAGCDDFWPKDSNPRCDECRFYVGITANSPVGARHGECHVKGEEHSNYWFCENWRAR